MIKELRSIEVLIREALETELPEEKKKAYREIQSEKGQAQGIISEISNEYIVIFDNAQPIKLKSNWWRAVRKIYNDIPLSAEGSKFNNGRFNFKPDEPCLYFSEDNETTMKEVELSQTRLPTTIFSVNIELNNVLDLSNDNLLEKYKINKDLLHGDWEIFNDLLDTRSYGQAISFSVQELGFEGLLFESIKVPGMKNLVIFENNLRKRSLIKIIDPDKTIKDKYAQISGIL